MTRMAQRAALIAACRDPKEEAVVEEMLRVWRRRGGECPVTTIIRAINRDPRYDDVFPQEQHAHRADIHRAFDRLARRGVIETATRSQVRYATLIMPKKPRRSVRTSVLDQPTDISTISPVGAVADAEVRASATLNTLVAGAKDGSFKEATGARSEPPIAVDGALHRGQPKSGKRAGRRTGLVDGPTAYFPELTGGPSPT